MRPSVLLTVGAAVGAAVAVVLGVGLYLIASRRPASPVAGGPPPVANRGGGRGAQTVAQRPPGQPRAAPARPAPPPAPAPAKPPEPRVVAMSTGSGEWTDAEPAASSRGQPILTEASVWRNFIAWDKPLLQVGEDQVQVKAGRIDPKARSPLPPPNWFEPDFDDSSWGPWRESHMPSVLKAASDSRMPDVRVYDEWQYGVQLSAFMALRCFRGKFQVHDPQRVSDLSLSLVYRGGVVVYVNGQEIGRGHVPRPITPDPACPAEPYPDEVFFGPDGAPWRPVNTNQAVPTDPLALQGFNRRMRKLTVSIPASLLKRGTNVLALEVHRAPYSERLGGDGMRWSNCGLATIVLRGQGAIEPALTRPKGVQVWNASILTKASPLGSTIGGRIGAGAGVKIYNFPLSWASPCDPLVPIRIVGARNGVFSGQVAVSSDSDIRQPKASMSDLRQLGGGGSIPASACQVCYSLSPKDPPTVLTDPPISLLDALYEEPPEVVEANPGKPQEAAPVGLKEFRGQSWSDSGALMGVWLKVRIPADVPPGDYEGTLTVRTADSQPVAVPVKLTVHSFVLPDPKDFVTHVAAVQSPDTLALKYKVQPWSPRHFALLDKSYSYMGQIGGKTLWIPLVLNSWLGNRQSLVYWVGQPDGRYECDFRLMDRYLDLAQKHLKPESVCVYVYHPPGVPGAEHRGFVSSYDPVTGKVRPLQAPAYAPTPEAIAFWKPVLAEIDRRLARRGLPALNVGTVIEGGRESIMEAVVELFKAAAPGAKWANLAHYGGSKGNIYGVPYGYVMSVWGNVTPFKSQRWGADDVPLVLVKHNRADPFIDLRPIACRGPQYWAAERGMGETGGIGPLGMDFWNLTEEEAGRRGGPRPMEGGVTNLNMYMFSTAAFLAPGPEGPISTARYEVFRQGLQACEARTAIEKALGDPVQRARVGEFLAQCCQEGVRRRAAAFEHYVRAGEVYAQGEGWKWFETSGWQEADGMLFDCAQAVRAPQSQIAAALQAPTSPLAIAVEAMNARSAVATVAGASRSSRPPSRSHAILWVSASAGGVALIGLFVAGFFFLTRGLRRRLDKSGAAGATASAARSS